MIDINRIRKGTWVRDSGGKDWQVDCWESPTKVAAKAPYIGEILGNSIYGHPLTEEVSMLQGVPLTVDLLKEFGFVLNCTKSTTTWFSKEPDIEENWLYQDKFVVTFSPSDDKGRQFRVTSLKIIVNYLHEVQDIFYCIFNKEITK